jgi:hypothetical protein
MASIIKGFWNISLFFEGRFPVATTRFSGAELAGSTVKLESFIGHRFHVIGLRLG